MARIALGMTLTIWLVSSVTRAQVAADEDARRLYAVGKAEYAQGRYEEALRHFEHAYALSQAPGLLFNMAQAQRLAGPSHCIEARSSYQRYLAALPDAENRREVEERLQELGECTRAEPNAPPAPVVEAPPPMTPLAARESRAPMLLTTASAAMLVLGGSLYIASYVKYRDAKDECPCYPGSYAKWETVTNVSYAALAAGGAGVLGGVAWWVFAEREPGTSRASVQLGARLRF